MSFQHMHLEGPLRETPPQPNRRVSVRYQCPLATTGRLVIDRTEYRQAWVLDLGAGGIGLILTRALEQGQQLIVQMKSSATGQAYQLPARVVHVTAQATGDWHIGCAFLTPLTEEQLDQLL